MVIVWARNFPNATRDHFLELIIFRATAKLANIHNRLTTFLYKNKFFFSKLNIKGSCIIFSWHGCWRLLCCIRMQYRQEETRQDYSDEPCWKTHGTVLEIKRTYWNGRSYWIGEVVLKCQCLQKFARITLLQVIDVISAVLQPFIWKDIVTYKKSRKGNRPAKGNYLKLAPLLAVNTILAVSNMSPTT